MGKGLSKDAKAQKLAFQHWIEAVSESFAGKSQEQYRVLICCLFSFCLFRLIPDIDMGIACISTMKNGVKLKLASHFSTGNCFCFKGLFCWLFVFLLILKYLCFIVMLEFGSLFF